ncbi:hypothetical protein HNR46_002019 [Haloferula luteola]|uniref:DUF2868 domain-containing protein n=1 Tax=Haloferula luteola TaxID=595692 RepID=A0A840VD11_9BACT|nr:hypothetical protein [Haloferula luteola]
MADAPEERWTLAELIDFEAALSSWDGSRPERVAGMSRMAAMKAWLEAEERGGIGRRWLAALGGIGFLLMVVMACSGVGAVWGVLDLETKGMNVVWMLGVVWVMPWGLMLLAVLLWWMRGRIPGGGMVAWVAERVSLRFLGEETREAIERVRRSGELARVIGWRMAALTQMVAASFHAGALVGLATMVLVKRVGFFWESTTQGAMRHFLEEAVRVLALPWSWALPRMVPDVAASEVTRNWMANGVGWWPFSLMVLLVWGVAPRWLLSTWARVNETRALRNLTFQAPAHRKLWRAMTEVKRGEEPKGPVDGALVISLGAEAHPEALRPFLLQRLRLNPTAWETMGVMDTGREEAARTALAKAPAGVVLVGEGWSLAPRQVERALAEILKVSEGRRVAVVVGNPSSSGMSSPTEEERREWERFMDRREESGSTELWFFESA